MPGTLFVVATPIGNLEDLTFRALRTLREVDLIAAEDTRRTAKLLAHYDVRKPLRSFHHHNEWRETPRLVERLLAGDRIALVTDAGTPGISDPGPTLVRAARDVGVAVVPIPGPSAVAAALSVSGFQADSFAFMGFPPRSGSARTQWLSALTANPGVVVFFESPHRLERTLSDLREYVIRPIQVFREITKIHEEMVVTPMNDDDLISGRGEFTCVVGPVPSQPTVSGVDEHAVADVFGRMVDVAGIDEDLAIAMIARFHNLSAAAARKLIKKATISAKQRRPPSP